MSNFVRVGFEVPVNMDLVETFFIKDVVNPFNTIHFVLQGNRDPVEWGFKDYMKCEKVYRMLLSNYTTTLNP